MRPGMAIIVLSRKDAAAIAHEARALGRIEPWAGLTSMTIVGVPLAVADVEISIAIDRTGMVFYL